MTNSTYLAGPIGLRSARSPKSEAINLRSLATLVFLLSFTVLAPCSSRPNFLSSVHKIAGRDGACL